MSRFLSRSLLVCAAIAAFFVYEDSRSAGFRPVMTARVTLALWLFWLGVRSLARHPDFMRGALSLWGGTLGAVSASDWESVSRDPIGVAMRSAVFAGIALVVRTALIGVRIPSFRAPAFVKAAVEAGAVSLDHVLFNWTKEDTFTVRDLLESVAIFGRTGSGKSSGSGLTLARAVVKLPKSSGLILASKPEDRNWWEKRFREQGRLNDLIVFGPEESPRCNFIDFEMQSGGDARSLVDYLMVTGESLAKGGEGESGKFWYLSKQRLFWSAIEPIRLAWGKVSIPAIQEFISSAATSPDQLSKVAPDGKEAPIENFKRGYHYRTMLAAGQKAASEVELHDFRLCATYWTEEFVHMDNKVRSSILADAMNVLFTYNTGIVREIVSTTTTHTPAVMEDGKWQLWDFSIDRMGPAAKLIMSAAKYQYEKFILRRHAGPDAPVCVIWVDEAQELVSSFDAAFLAKCRSHRGCLAYLTQSIHSYKGVDD